MSDEQPEAPVEAIHFTLHQVVTADRWPARTSLAEEWLTHAHVYGATAKDDTVTFSIGNGGAVYRLRRDLPNHQGGIVAELVSGDSPARLKQLKKKFEREPVE